jgi:hypothetical protein
MVDLPHSVAAAMGDSRRYAMFTTPVAYLIDEAGVIIQDVAAGTDAILDLIARAEDLFHDARRVVPLA